MKFFSNPLQIILFYVFLAALVGQIDVHIILINSNPVPSNVCFLVIVFDTKATNALIFKLDVSISPGTLFLMKTTFHLNPLLIQIILSLQMAQIILSPSTYLQTI